jgi:hypothetical protein
MDQTVGEDMEQPEGEDMEQAEGGYGTGRR